MLLCSDDCGGRLFCWQQYLRILLLRSKLYLWGSPFWVQFLRIWPFFFFFFFKLLTSYTTRCHTCHVGLRWTMCIACSALFRHILKDVRVFAFHPTSAVRCSNQNLAIFYSITMGSLKFAIFTTDTRTLRVNPTIEVVTFHLHGWCMLGVFFFFAGILLPRTWISGTFESVRWNTCVQRLDLGLYSHLKVF